MTHVLPRLSWYKNRLAAMSAAEILYRGREFARRKLDRLFTYRLTVSLRDYGTLPGIPGLRAGLEAWQIPDGLGTQWMEDARRAQQETPYFFGRNWPACSREERWHLDPISETLWPRDVYCFSIDYRHTSDKGDIKFVWELNRLQYLQPVAALAFKNKDAGLAKFCLSEIESWIDNNPPFLGVNWTSGIELALRVISILTVTTLTGEHLSRAQRSKIWSSLHTHARWIARYPSRFSSSNNHRTAEALGLFVIGALCPHFAEAAVWKQTGWDILCDAAQRQILPDGAGAEQAVAYAASVLETLLIGLKIARSSDVNVPDFYVRKITLGGEYLRWLTDAQGHMPHISDDDNACVFGAYHEGDSYAASVLSCIAAATGRADLSPPESQPHVRQALFGHAPSSDFIPYGVRCFNHGGITICRHKNTGGDVLLAFDHGPLGYLSIAAHGHADALALWLHIGDQPVFVDAGTYLYHSQKNERQYFRSTAAHNTLTLESADSSIMSGSFNWSRKATATLRSFEQNGSAWKIEAEHDGYVERFQAIIRRSLNVSPDSGAVIQDRLFAPVAHQVEIGFLLHPELTARHEGSEIVISKNERILLRLRHESPLQTIIGAPDTREGGWYSPSFGIKQPTTRLIFKGTLAPEQPAVTRLYWAFPAQA